MADNTKQSVHRPAGKHLPLAVPVHVQCEGFRCLAYRDKHGIWIDYNSGERLHGTVRIIEYNFD